MWMNLNSVWDLSSKLYASAWNFTRSHARLRHPWFMTGCKSCCQRDSSNPFLAKAEGMLHFHVEGMRPLTEQTWPECVANQTEVDVNYAFYQIGRGMMSNFDGCQLPGVPKFSTASAQINGQIVHSSMSSVMLALPWNRYVKKWLKQAYIFPCAGEELHLCRQVARDFALAVPFKTGDLVGSGRREEIDSTLIHSKN